MFPIWTLFFLASNSETYLLNASLEMELSFRRDGVGEMEEVCPDLVLDRKILRKY